MVGFQRSQIVILLKKVYILIDSLFEIFLFLYVLNAC